MCEIGVGSGVHYRLQEVTVSYSTHYTAAHFYYMCVVRVYTTVVYSRVQVTCVCMHSQCLTTNKLNKCVHL